MANAQQILTRKPDEQRGDVVSVAPDATVVEAAQLMNEHHIGSLVVVDDGALVGIFTERDVMRRVVADHKDPDSTRVGDVMTSPVACAAPNTPTAEMGAVMREKRIRHLPVVDEGRVVGMISIGDLNRAQHQDQARTIGYLEQFISVG